MRTDVVAQAVLAGFSNEPAGTHTSRTLMFRELDTLLTSLDGDASYEAYAAAAVEGNILGKATRATRMKTFRHLRELYALRGTVPVFAALRALWFPDPRARRLMALLAVVARDPLLRATADLITASPTGTVLTSADFAAEIGRSFPGRFTDDVLARTGRNIASSWTQSGHIVGRAKKVRTRADARPLAAAYALYLGHLQQATGSGLFSTSEVLLLDAPDNEVRQLAQAASRIGWITYRAAAGMTEVTFRELDHLAAPAQELTHER